MITQLTAVLATVVTGALAFPANVAKSGSPCLVRGDGTTNATHLLRPVVERSVVSRTALARR